MYFFVIASSILIYKILRKNCDKPEYREKYPRFTNNLDSLSIYFNSLNNKNLESTIDFNNNYSTISDSESDSDTDIDTDLDTDSDSNSDIDTILDSHNKTESYKNTKLETNLEENKDDSKKQTELDTKLDENKEDKSTQIDEVQLSKEIIEKLVIKDNTKVNDETKLEESLLDEIITEEEKSLSKSKIFKFKNNKILVGEDEENNVIINEL